MIELVITVVIAGILMAVAVPGMRSYIQNAKATSLADIWVSSLAYARSEAVARSTAVSLCPTTTGSSCGTSSQWTSGWLIFVDAAGNGSYDSSADTIIKVRDTLGANTTFTTTQSFVTYSSMGAVKAGAGTFLLKATNCTGANSRTVTLNATGEAIVTVATC